MYKTPEKENNQLYQCSYYEAHYHAAKKANMSDPDARDYAFGKLLAKQTPELEPGKKYPSVWNSVSSFPPDGIDVFMLDARSHECNLNRHHWIAEPDTDNSIDKSTTISYHEYTHWAPASLLLPLGAEYQEVK